MTEQTQQQTPEQHRSVLIDLFALVWRNRGVAVATFAIIVLSTVIMVLVVTPRYTARATFVPPPDEGGGLASVLRDPILAFASGIRGASVDRLVGYLDSETVRRKLVAEYGLIEHYKTRNRSYALQRLEKRTRITVTPEGVITVDVTDTDPELATEMANRYVALTDSLFMVSQRLHATQMRRFMEDRVAESEQQMRQAELAMREFGEQHGVVALPEQVEVLVRQIAVLDAQISEVDIRIGAARQILGPRHSSVREMEIERAHIVSERRKLMESSGGRPGGDPLLTMADVPERSLEFLRLKRNIHVQTVIQELLYRQYEMAKLDEARNVSTLVRIDHATVPELKSWPMRTRLVIVSAAMGLVWAVLLAWFVENGPRLLSQIVGPGNSGRTIR